MKNSFAFLFLSIVVLLLCISCEKQTDLSKEFSCKDSNQLQQLEVVTDFNNNFMVSLPKHWNTKLYYDSVQSEIFSADTLKSLTKSYIMNFSWVSDSIEISKKLQEKVRQKSLENNMKTAKESFHNYSDKKAYAHLGVGENNTYAFHVFQYYVKFNDENYLRIKAEFYGDADFDSRFCEAISIIETIKTQLIN